MSTNPIHKGLLDTTPCMDKTPRVGWSTSTYVMPSRNPLLETSMKEEGANWLSRPGVCVPPTPYDGPRTTSRVLACIRQPYNRRLPGRAGVFVGQSQQ